MMSLTSLKLPHKVIVRAPGLLPMMYTLKNWLCSRYAIQHIEGWLSADCLMREMNGRIWINGELFPSWVNNQRMEKAHRKLANDEGFCMSCNQARKIENPKILHVKGKVKQIRGVCPVCHHTICRGIRDD